LFIGYNYLERPIDTASVPAVAVSGQLLAVLGPEPNTIATVNSATPPGRVQFKRKADVVPAFSSVKRALNAKKSSGAEKTPDLSAFQKPIVITYRTEYPKTSTKGREPDVRSCTAEVKPGHKKKSFMSKAMPVLKKPYDWLKAIASKIR
jgi:hypothetical protein